MRLDSYLVEIGNIGSRSRAKRAIIEGYVRVNDTIITRPSFDVAYSDRVKITEDTDKPAGYWKLKEIQDKTKIIREGDNVLDAGSSAGGFLMFASEIASHVHGIEFSHEFRSELGKLAYERPNISFEFADVFSMSIEDENYDVLLLDITVNPIDSIKALRNLSPALKRGGILLHVLKLPEKNDIRPVIEELSSTGFMIKEIIEADRKEAYVIAQKL